jgi:hypothetical protein
LSLNTHVGMEPPADLSKLMSILMASLNLGFNNRKVFECYIS